MTPPSDAAEHQSDARLSHAPNEAEELKTFAEAVGVKPGLLHHFASAKGMVVAFAGVLGATFGAGRYAQSFALDVAMAKAEAASAHSAVSAMAAAPDVPDLRQRVARIEEHDADIILAVRSLDSRQRRAEVNAYITCSRLGGGQQCLSPIAASTVP